MVRVAHHQPPQPAHLVLAHAAQQRRVEAVLGIGERRELPRETIFEAVRSYLQAIARMEIKQSRETLGSTAAYLTPPDRA